MSNLSKLNSNSIKTRRSLKYLCESQSVIIDPIIIRSYITAFSTCSLIFPLLSNRSSSLLSPSPFALTVRHFRTVCDLASRLWIPSWLPTELRIPFMRLYSLLKLQCIANLSPSTRHQKRVGPGMPPPFVGDISPPSGVRAAMEMQAEAECKKRAQILESEGGRQSNINIADGRKSSVILESEAAMVDQFNRAKGEAEAILAKAKATLEGLAPMCKVLKDNRGVERTTILLPISLSNPANMIGQALNMYKVGNVSGHGHLENRVGIENSAKDGGPSAETGDETTNFVRPMSPTKFY